MNDKSLKKLDALLKTYHSALFDDEVFKSFSALVSKAKKFAKPEMRDAVNEYAAKIASIHSGGSGEVAAVVGEDDAAAAAAGGEEGEGEAGKSDGDKEDVGAPFTEKAGDENQPDAGDDDAENGKKGGRRKSVADKEKPLTADKENTRRKARSTAR
jgi:condensin complex subunit 1